MNELTAERLEELAVSARGINPFKQAAEHAIDTITDLRADVAKLQRFKDWVHAFLDGKGVPHHPPGTHGAEGCRIGDRMDWVWAESDSLRAECERLRNERDAAVKRLGEAD